MMILGLLLAQPVLVTAADAQQAPRSHKAAEREYPAGVSVHRGKTGSLYADSRGMTLYRLDARIAFTRSGGERKFCNTACAARWAPLAAPADAKPIGDWKVVDGGLGPQWAFRNNPVFTHRADKSHGDTLGDGDEQIWAAIAYIPPPPELTAPPGVVPLYLESRYVLADGQGRVLLAGTHPAACAAACAKLVPLLAGMAAQPVGDWTVLRDGDRPQWGWRGKPVFANAEVRSIAVPAGAQILRP